MESEVKIPTLLGLGILVFGLVSGVFLITHNSSLSSNAAGDPTPKHITVVNISSTSASIYWQTEVPTSGFTKTGTDPEQLDSSSLDDRDLSHPLEHTLHYVTLRNLTPNTTYYYQIFSSGKNYPAKPWTFTTSTQVAPTSASPLVGNILDISLKPISEALVILTIPGTQPTATITKNTGSFILPLSTIKDTNLTHPFTFLDSGTRATLTITDFKQTSTITLKLPLKKGDQIPPIILGQSLDLSTPESSPTPMVSNKFDLNQDGILNSTDLNIVVKNIGKDPKSAQGDLNGDGAINQKDVDILQQEINQQAQ